MPRRGIETDTNNDGRTVDGYQPRPVFGQESIEDPLGKLRSVPVSIPGHDDAHGDIVIGMWTCGHWLEL